MSHSLLLASTSTLHFYLAKFIVHRALIISFCYIPSCPYLSNLSRSVHANTKNQKMVKKKKGRNTNMSSCLSLKQLQSPGTLKKKNKSRPFFCFFEYGMLIMLLKNGSRLFSLSIPSYHGSHAKKKKKKPVMTIISLLLSPLFFFRAVFLANKLSFTQCRDRCLW